MGTEIAECFFFRTLDRGGGKVEVVMAT
jgi:hypothetical protein